MNLSWSRVLKFTSEKTSTDLILVAISVVAVVQFVVTSSQHIVNRLNNTDMSYRGEIEKSGFFNKLQALLPEPRQTIYASARFEDMVRRREILKDGVFGYSDFSKGGYSYVTGLLKSYSQNVFSGHGYYYGYGWISPIGTVINDKDTLDFLGLNIVIISDLEYAEFPQIEQRLEYVGDYKLTDSNERLLFYRNPQAMPRALLYAPDGIPEKIKFKSYCEHNRLMCADWGPLKRQALPQKVETTGSEGHYQFKVQPHEGPLQLVFKQAYKKDWVAFDENNRNLEVDSLYGGFIKIQVPPQVDSIKLEFQPSVFKWLWALSGLTVLACLVFLFVGFSRKMKTDAAYGLQ